MKQIWRVITFTRELWRYYLLVSVFTILLAGMSQLQPLFTKGTIDQITKLSHGGHPDITLVAIFAIAIFLSDFGATIFSNIGGHIGDLLMIKQQRLLSERYFKHLLSLPQQYFDTELTGKIINRMSRGISQISQFTQMMSNNFLQFIFSTVFSLIIVFYYSWQVGLMLTLLYPVFIWLTTRTSSRWQGYQKTINAEQDAASGRFAEAIGQVKVVKSYLQEKRELSVFSKHLGTAVKTTKPQSMFWHKQDVVRRSVLNVIFLAIYAYIFIAAAHGRYSISTMVLLIQYAALIRIPIFSISFLVDQTQRTISNTKDYFEAMDEQPAIVDADAASELKVTEAAINFKDVTFAYKDGNAVLKGVSFDLPADSKTALVGESGEGKTTITSMLLRLYSVDSGSITIDGQDITHVTQASLRQNIAVVFQEPALFSGTVRENIAYANPRATDKQVIAAANAANAHEFISKFDKGYDSEIGERGLKLSGGQKQRLAIARALLKDAPILILDEATSSLDSKSERMVQEALERLMKGRTTLIIAHRLSTIQAVDQIVTIRGGLVDEVGSPANLAKSKGIYAQLLELQSQSSESNKKKLKNYEIAG
ncbi:MAG: (1--_2) glucan export composite transrane/ATP-binding protein [Candidatus Saccharibacteria bacterium]|nr:(1-->2) glucan export composite transrane/ATP-binding protein [Candidatus Saccharibacteria bacterium]